jgi:hypothetical protein
MQHAQLFLRLQIWLSNKSFTIYSKPMKHTSDSLSNGASDCEVFYFAFDTGLDMQSVKSINYVLYIHILSKMDVLNQAYISN